MDLLGYHHKEHHHDLSPGGYVFITGNSMGHLHGALTSHTPDRLKYDAHTGKIKSVKVIATLSGSWTKGFMQSTEENPINSGYGERAGYKPTRSDATNRMYPETKDMELTS